MRRLWAAGAAMVVCLALGGMPALAQEASESPAATCPPGALPAASIDPALVPDEEGFLLEEIEPGVSRLVSDGAGHSPSARYICEARDLDRIAVQDDGSVVVWWTPHGSDNRLGGRRVWILGQEGTRSEYPEPQPSTGLGCGSDEDLWLAGQVAADEQGLGKITADDRLGSRSDGTLWAMVDARMGRYPARFDGQAWTVYSESSGSRPEHLVPGLVAPDGSLWWLRCLGDVSECSRSPGLTRFDGRSTQQFLAGYAVNSIAFAPDGRTWVAVGHEDGEPGAIVVIEPGVQGPPVDAAASQPSRAVVVSDAGARAFTTSAS